MSPVTATVQRVRAPTVKRNGDPNVFISRPVTVPVNRTATRTRQYPERPNG